VEIQITNLKPVNTKLIPSNLYQNVKNLMNFVLTVKVVQNGLIAANTVVTMYWFNNGLLVNNVVMVVNEEVKCLPIWYITLNVGIIPTL